MSIKITPMQAAAIAGIALGFVLLYLVRNRNKKSEAIAPLSTAATYDPVVTKENSVGVVSKTLLPEPAAIAGTKQLEFAADNVANGMMNYSPGTASAMVIVPGTPVGPSGPLKNMMNVFGVSIPGKTPVGPSGPLKNMMNAFGVSIPGKTPVGPSGPLKTFANALGLKFP